MARRKISKKKTTKKRPAKETEVPKTVTIHYIKSAQHRSIHVDGVFGSASPHGAVNASFFSSRFPIPIETTHKVGSKGQISDETISQITKNGFVREIEISATMDPNTAEKIGKWLLLKAADAKKLRKRNE